MKAVNKPMVMAAALGCILASQTTMADMAIGVRAGTFGVGADFDVGLIENVLNLRLGYNTFSYSRTVQDTEVKYDGKLKIGAASALFDWHVFHGGFRLSLGAIQKGPHIDVTGTPTNGSYTLNGTTYQGSEIGSLNGNIKMGSSTAPYVGIGWGNTTDKEDRLTFLLDIGAIHTGSPQATLNVTCGTATQSNCDAFKASIADDVTAEITKLEDSSRNYKWYPVIALGLAVRF